MAFLLPHTSRWFLIILLIGYVESAPPLILTPEFLLVAEDHPIGDDLPLTICPGKARILTGDPDHYFSVEKLNDSCSTLRLQKQLDADRESDGARGQSFSLVLAGKKNSRATLDIQVVDVNDNAPVFIGAPSVINVPEDMEIGSVIAKIRTRDPDTGIGGLARFYVTDEFVGVDKQKCAAGECWTTLRLKKKLDFETQKIHDIVVEVEDGDPSMNRTNKAEHSIAIHVTDAQDQPPVFTSDLSRARPIDNEASVGDEIMKITALDGDFIMDKKNEIRYSMNENGFLQIDPITGSVTIKALPTGDGAEIVVTVRATELDEKAMYTEAELLVKFSREDTFPEPKASTIHKAICPTTTKGSILEGESSFTEPLVIHLARNVNNPILRTEDDDGIFAVRQSENKDEILVEVWKPEQIDFEQKKQINFKVIIEGEGECEVEVEVLDVNDNSPKFVNDTFLFYVTENEKPSVLGKVKAIDPDSEAFLPLKYSIVGNGSEFFGISDDGELRSLQSIDRELHDRFNLVIRATDAGGKWTDCPGKVIIKDVNDNAPVFENRTIVIELDEQKSLKYKINATDPDLGENGLLSYSLEDLPEGAPIDVSAGILFIGKMDRDTMESDRISFKLVVSDQGQPPQSSTANVTIKVKDINDNYPVFTNSRISIVLDANISPGGVIGAVSAEDGDATSPNNYIQYSSSDPNYRVTDTGEILYTGEGVLSKDSTAEFTVVAYDGGIPVRNATATVIINEHRRSLQSELTAEIQSNDTDRVEIKWANSGMNGYSYELVRATADGYKDAEVKKWLSIDPKSGRIHTTTALTPDMTKQIRLYISMKKGKREVPVELIINVIDTDTTPFFKQDNYKTTAPEDVTKGTKLLQVQASGENKYKYTLAISRGPQKTLAIDENGWIYTLKPLDFEKETIIDGTVVASDNQGQFAKTNFSIVLTDVNDNRPVFKNGSIFIASVEENSPVGTQLALPYPLATDNDIGDNEKLKYSIVGDQSIFRINKTTSVIELIGALDFESQKVHSLAIRCSDGVHEVFAAVTVQVVDSNDNVPQILNSDLHQLSIGEDVALGTVVAIISAVDADEGGKQLIRLDANHENFRVDEDGKLVVAKSLKGLAGKRICSSIIANDTGTPPLTSTNPYCVTVYPAAYNHHSPLIVSPKQNSIHYFDENVKYEELLRVQLLDEGDMSNIVYKLDTDFKKDYEMFRVNETGSLSAKAPFDFEKKASHELKLLACRSNNCSSLHLFISVNDRNDNCPIFPKQDVKLTIIENDRSPVPRIVGRIPEALDADFHNDNTKVCYSSNSPKFFIKDPTLPVLYTNTSFDREQTPEHSISIVAYDCLLSCIDPHKPMNTSILVTVKVEDVNDNFPRFSEKHFQTTVIQGHVSPGSHLLKLTATDADEEKDGLKYSVKGMFRAGKLMYSLAESPVAVDEKTGEVSANEALKESMYSFTASVVDGVGHEDTASVTIFVVTYDQQAELLFDSPFDFIQRNEKRIVTLLSEATSLKAVIDRCRQNANFTLVLAHFLDQNDNFVEVDKALSSLMSANGTARKELRGAFGLRDAAAPVPATPRVTEAIAIGIGAALLLIIVLLTCLWCRSRNSYSDKLRHISHQAAHHATIGRPVKNMPPSVFCVDGTTLISGRMPAPAPPLQSTEL